MPLLFIYYSSLCILIVLYDRDVCLRICTWRPFHKAFGIFKRNWDIRTSVGNRLFYHILFTYTYVKVLGVLSDLLMYIHVYTSDDKSSTRPFYDPTLHYFSERHLATICSSCPNLSCNICWSSYSFWFFIHFNSFITFFHFFLYAGTFFMLLLIHFRAVTKMVLIQGLSIVGGLHNWVYS